MEGKKWIFIEASETVRYKVGDSDSSMDSEDYEYLPTKKSPSPSTFEFILSKKEELSASGDELEIHDNHFSSCPTSEVEDSDIEVVMKSPSSSETASLCSFNSQKSVPNDTLTNYDDVIFTVDITNEIDLDHEEEEDSEVEVISRSIHRNGSIEMSYVAEINSADTSLNTSISSGSENEIEDEVEETVPSIYIPPFLHEDDDEEVLEMEEDPKDEEDCILQSSEKLDETNHIESLEDYGIKYLLEDLHVSRQINGRLVGLKTSTLALTVCLSITLGVYLGNYMNPTGQMLENDTDTILVPEDVVHSTNEDPLRVNITFKYSSSTKESLRSVLNSFRKLKNDYDRLHTAYADIKEKCSLKKQMNFYWRKQVKQNAGEDEVGSDNILKGNRQIATKAKLTRQKERDLFNNTYHAQERAIQKLTRDLKKERKSAMYWKKKYNKVEFSKSNTCSKYDDPKSSFFSFSDCFNIFSKVIPSLDISAINITNRAESLADHVQHAWSRLSGRWNAKIVRKDDPLYLRKVNRFRKIFIIGNVVNSEKHIYNHKNTKDFENETMEQNLSCDNPQVDLNIKRYSKRNESIMVWDVVETPHQDADSINSPSNILTEDRNQEYDKSHSRDNSYIHHTTNNNSTGISSECYKDEIKWYRFKFQESKFLFDVYKWKDIFKSEIDMMKSQHTSHLVNENKRQLKRIEELRDTERENKILKEKVKNKEEYLENTRKKLSYMLVSEQQKCNTSIEMVKATMRGRYGYLIKNIQNNMRTAEKYKYDKKVRTLLAKERKKNKLSIRRKSKTIRKEERCKYRRKLRILTKSFERNMKRDFKRFRMMYHERQQHRWNKTRYQNNDINRNNSEQLPKHEKKINDRQELGEQEEKGRNKRGKSRDKERLRKKFQHKYQKILNENQRESYAYKYKKSVEELSQLKKVHKKVVKKNKFRKKEVDSYKRELEMYKEIIIKYEQRMKDVREKEKEHELEILRLLQRMKDYNQMTTEDSRLKLTVIAPSSEFKELIIKENENSEDVDIKINENSEDVHMNENENSEDVDVNENENSEYVDITKNKNSEEDVEPTKKNETPNDYIFELSGNKCRKDPGRKPFYNIEDVFPSNLFSRSIDMKPPSPSKPLTILPTPVTSQSNHLHIPSSARPEMALFDSSFSEDFSFFVTNKSQIDNNEGNRYWDNGEVNEYPRDENLITNNWYVNWMREKNKFRKARSSESDALEKEDNWFWRAMKEREKLRSRDDDINWFWKFMKGREEFRSKLRSSQDGDVNWFWKAMKEREKLREGEEETY